jgi:hypothetical protein
VAHLLTDPEKDEAFDRGPTVAEIAAAPCHWPSRVRLAVFCHSKAGGRCLKCGVSGQLAPVSYFYFLPLLGTGLFVQPPPNEPRRRLSIVRFSESGWCASANSIFGALGLPASTRELPKCGIRARVGELHHTQTTQFRSAPYFTQSIDVKRCKSVISMIGSKGSVRRKTNMALDFAPLGAFKCTH